ncbi:MAG: esterase family protein [Elusimicrobia bacterium]|nr:esterase family protein [Elusimicrobiota bacterium]MBU2614627.1 esterase family protein [Elusimicrobiota bacterium]
MALIHCGFFSEVLQISTSMYVILPQTTKKHPALYLLHGLSDDHTAWTRRTSIERYVESLGLAVVMPAVNRSFYTDMAHGAKYWTFISEELPKIARSLFPLSVKRNENFAAGISMGGYGAFKLALNFPDKFAAAASLSGSMDVEKIGARISKEDMTNVFGVRPNFKKSNSNLFFLADKLAKSKGPKPKLYQCCGTKDFLYEDNKKFRDHCKRLPLDYTYEEEPGTHEWGYWDKKIQRVLHWLPLR